MLTLIGCSPALNWREVRVNESPLRLLLPCKPDQAQREVVMAGQTLSLAMRGCDADGATFAVAHVRVADAAQADLVLAGWKAAVLAHVHAADVAEQPLALPGGWSTPQSVRLQARGQRADGQAVMVQAAWFARVDAGGVHLFHAVLFMPRARPDVTETFFSSLSLS